MQLVGHPAPHFVMPSTKSEKPLSLTDYRGKWLVLFFYSLDFTFVCPTEVTAISQRAAEFTALGAEVLGVSTDSIFTHKAWMATSHDHNGLDKPLHYPLASDLSLKVSRDYGVLVGGEGIALRGLFILDPEGIVQYQVVHNLNVGCSVDEILRVLQALQSGGLCAADWRPGQENLVGQ